MHAPVVQLPHPEVSIVIDSDEATAIATGRTVLNRVSARGWWVGAAHLRFPASDTFDAPAGDSGGPPTPTGRYDPHLADDGD